MPVTPLVLIVNVTILLLVITVMIIILRWGSQFSYNYGLPITEVLQKRLRWMLIILIILSLGAVVFNIIAPLLEI